MFSSFIASMLIAFNSLFSFIPMNADMNSIEDIHSDIAVVNPYDYMGSNAIPMNADDFANAMDNCEYMNTDLREYEDCTFYLSIAHMDVANEYWQNLTLSMNESNHSANRFFTFRDTSSDIGVPFNVGDFTL